MADLPDVRSFQFGILQSAPKVLYIIKLHVLSLLLFYFSGVDCSADDMVKKMTYHVYGSKKVMWMTKNGSETILQNFQGTFNINLF